MLEIQLFQANVFNRCKNEFVNDGKTNRHITDCGSDHARAEIFQVTVQSMYK